MRDSTAPTGWMAGPLLTAPTSAAGTPPAWGRAAAASWLGLDPACLPPARATRGVATEDWGCAINLDGCPGPHAYRRAWQVMVEVGGTPFEEGLCDHSR